MPVALSAMDRPITSCLTCRRRKVRCDRSLPTCSACRKGTHICVYQSISTSRQLPSPASHTNTTRHRKMEDRIMRLEKLLETSAQGNLYLESTQPDLWTPSPSNPACHFDGPTNEGGQNGSLILEEGCSRFVSPLHWASVEEMRDLKSALMSPDDLTEQASTSSQSCDGNLHPMPYQTCLQRLPSTNLLFRLNPEPNQTLLYYPETVADCQLLLETFLQNVEPIVRIIHPPSLREQFTRHISRLEVYESTTEAKVSYVDGNQEITKHFEALAFGIFFSAINSMNPATVQTRFAAPKSKLLQRFQNGLELALERHGLLSSPAIPVLQAFVLLLTCLCREDDAQRAWTLVGLAVRVAQSLGLHREPTLFPSKAMDAIQVEIRRRLWHQIFHLDFRTAVSQGLQPLIGTDSFDTRLPSNVDDEDLVPGQKPLPYNYDPEKFTQMTMHLVRLNGVHCMQQLIHRIYPGHSTNLLGLNSGTPRDQSFCYQNNSLAEVNQEKEMRMLIEATLEKNQMLYLRHCDPSIPVQRGILVLANHIKWKFWIVFYHRFSNGKNNPSMSPELRALIFSQSLNLLETYILASKEKEYEPFRWHIDSHSGLHATSYILLQLNSPYFEAEQDAALLERGRKALRAMRDIHVNDDSKAWSLLRKKIDLVCLENSSMNHMENVQQQPNASTFSMGLTLQPNFFSQASSGGPDLVDLDPAMMMVDHDMLNMDDWLFTPNS